MRNGTETINTMKLLVPGTTGSTGSQIVKQVLEQGHRGNIERLLEIA